MRLPTQVTLFSPTDLTNAEVQKVNHEVFEWQRQRRLNEEQAYASFMLFEHQPENFEWCEGYTREINKYFTRADARRFRDALLRNNPEDARKSFNEVALRGQDLRRASRDGDAEAAARLDAIRRDRADPVSGEATSYFVLARHINGDGGCKAWEPAED